MKINLKINFTAADVNWMSTVIAKRNISISLDQPVSSFSDN